MANNPYCIICKLPYIRRSKKQDFKRLCKSCKAEQRKVYLKNYYSNRRLENV